jgi:heme exporter protein A
VSRVIDLHDVGVRLGGRPVLDCLGLVVDGGDVVEVTGPNGSGKTTLLRTLATLIRPTHGSGVVFDRALGKPEIRQIRSRIGFITHHPALIDELTLGENLLHFARLRELDPERCRRALDVVGLDGAADRRSREASFGMKRRAEIAWQLVSKPDLLLLDEARSGLDHEARDLVSALVDSTVTRGGAVVVVSHEPTGMVDSDRHRGFRLVGGSLEPVS